MHLWRWGNRGVQVWLRYLEGDWREHASLVCGVLHVVKPPDNASEAPKLR